MTIEGPFVAVPLSGEAWDYTEHFDHAILWHATAHGDFGSVGTVRLVFDTDQDLTFTDLPAGYYNRVRLYIPEGEWPGKVLTDIVAYPGRNLRRGDELTMEVDRA